MDDLEEAEICFSSFKYLEALECLNRIQEPAEVYFMQGKCYEKLNKRVEAKLFYGKAIDMDHVGAHNSLGFILDKRKPESKTLFQNALRLNCDPQTSIDYINKGDSLDGLERYQEAIDSFQKAIELNPNDAIAIRKKGRSLHNLEKYDEAIACYDEAIKINPNFSEALQNKGSSLKNMNRHEKAITFF